MPQGARNPLLGRLIGPHLPLRKGLRRAAERAGSIGATAIQVFADNPTSWRRRSGPPEGLEEFLAELRARGVRSLAIHAPYLINLAAADPDVREKSITTLTTELRLGSAFGAHAVNVHVGSHVGRGAHLGIDLVAGAVARVLAAVDDAPGSPLLVLENSAGQGNGLGSSIEELAAILDAAAAHGANDARIGICLDTAHLWGAGYALDDPDAVDCLLREVEARLGPHRLRMLHLNDSKVARGARRDRHEHIGAGMIGQAGLRYVLVHPGLAGIPVYLETPGMDAGFDAVNMDRVRRLIAGEPLGELPERALGPGQGDRARAMDRAIPDGPPGRLPGLPDAAA